MGILGKLNSGLATLGPIGYLPAPGTFGTLCAVPVMYAVRSMVSQPVSVGIAMGMMLGASCCVYYALSHFEGNSDPSQIVIDEFIGFSFLACALPLDAVAFSIGFLFFRFFDIVKPLGIKTIEQLPGVVGIMLDDLVAAVYAGLCAYGVLYALWYANLYFHL